MQLIPSELKYTETHLWFASTGGDDGVLGLTAHAQAKLGDLIAVEMPRPGVTLGANETLAYLEGMLDSMELTAPANVHVLEVNPRLEVHPSAVNTSPYENGWIAKVQLQGVVRWMDSMTYARYLQTGLVVEGA